MSGLYVRVVCMCADARPRVDGHEHVGCCSSPLFETYSYVLHLTLANVIQMARLSCLVQSSAA